MALQYLEFDLSEDSEGLQSWDAVASPTALHNAALLAEVQQLLHCIERALGESGSLEDGHVWNMDMLIQDENGNAVALDASPAPVSRLTLSLSLSGRNELAELLG